MHIKDEKTILKNDRRSTRISRFLQHFPRRFCKPLFVLMADIGWAFDKDNRRYANRHLRFAYPNKNRQWRSRLARRSYEQALLNGADVLWLSDIKPQLHNQQVLENAIATGKGACIVTLHLGSWETLTLTLRQHDYPTTLIARIPRSYTYLDKCYKQAGISYIADRQPDTFMKVMQAIKQGRFVCFNSDGYTDEVPVTFFGRHTSGPMGAITLAMMMDVNVMIGWCWRSGKDEYHTSFEPFELERTGNKERDIASNVQRIFTRMEALIREHPDQWLWCMDRFKQPGEQSLSKPMK